MISVVKHFDNFVALSSYGARDGPTKKKTMSLVSSGGTVLQEFDTEAQKGIWDPLTSSLKKTHIFKLQKATNQNPLLFSSHLPGLIL